MKRIIALLFVCLFAFCGCVAISTTIDTSSGDTLPETSEINERPTETKHEQETKTENEPEEYTPPFGLTEKELECILNALKEKNMPFDSIADIYDISYLGYRKIYTDTGIEYDYSTKEYGVCLKNGPACNLSIPVEDLE